ncbi:biotin--[acetyl-CoA-carboxylase] ligase [Phocaeicola oris]|uniref:biotin--[acetyl-CoA-carboxylase] ligase n=1 Tax=Phocaeicola oris TaxID=2896850 RepID=UPI00234FAD8D|nr:biotin--[acetyl-CoA-carboxylase] ligase [Phocaeicola oris]MCE2616861.1 biotin--[acetyl-CoA-carboxylase] ligase [Phocaeicola oris]
MSNTAFPLIHVEEINSTNSYLSALCEKQEVADFTVVLSEFQSEGRGQRGNSWESDPHRNLTFSYVLHPYFIDVHHQFLLSEIASLAVKDTLSVYTNDISIKWPNDIYWKDKKICGMLIENNLTNTCINWSVNGIGININQETFHSSAPNPVSLKQITGKEYQPRDILNRFIEQLMEYYDMLRNGENRKVDRLYRHSLFHREGFHTYKDKIGIFKAKITDIEPNGRIVLTDQSGNGKRYMFKEVEYIL